jgi:DNA-binding beta-propeller fold protein YncE
MGKFSTGDYEYELVPDWGQLPEGWEWGQVAAVATDPEDNVHVFTRAANPYRVFDKSGKLLDQWGEGLFASAHGICVTPDYSYLVDVGAHVVSKFDHSGKLQFTIGNRDQPSDTGLTKQVRQPTPLSSGEDKGPASGSYTEAIEMINPVGHAGPPFNRPTDVTIAPNGDIYVSDGYDNCCVHRFAADGTLIQSWGMPGNAGELRNTKDGPGHFHCVHGIWYHKDKVYVNDRESNRIQIFGPTGDYIDTWTGLLRPTKIYIDAQTDLVYVSELDDRVSVLDLDGNVLSHIGPGHKIGYSDEGRSHEPGKFWGPHGIWADTEGSVYVSEVLEGQRLQKFVRVK